MLKTKNWKYCNKIIFKYVISVMEPSFNLIFAFFCTCESHEQCIKPTKKRPNAPTFIFQYNPNSTLNCLPTKFVIPELKILCDIFCILLCFSYFHRSQLWLFYKKRKKNIWQVMNIFNAHCLESYVLTLCLLTKSDEQNKNHMLL